MIHKKISAWIIALCVVFASLGPSLVAAATSFPDISREWYGYVDRISLLQERGVIHGYPDGTFRPNTPINRAEFLKLVFAAKSEIQPSGSECFWDIPAGVWYGPYVCAAKRRGIVDGYSNGSFKPEKIVLTVEAIKMLSLAYGRTVEEPKGELWYKPYTDLLNDDHILPRSSYLPAEPLTRARAADLIVRMLKYDEERLVMRTSPGCGRPISPEPLTVMVNGIERTYLLTVPAKYIASQPTPLIVAFHGRTNSNEQVRKYFGFDRNATEFFVAYPAAVQTPTGTFTWSDGSDKASQLRDVMFFDALVKQLSERYCIDMDRIFTAGHSLGAWFGNSVACIRGGVVQGSATVGGNSVLIDCAGPASAMIMNNPKDTLSPHKSAELVRDQRLRENGCTQESRPVPGSTLSCIEYTQCDEGKSVQWCPHTIDSERDGRYYPHVWPPDAAKTIVSFFRSLKG